MRGKNRSKKGKRQRTHQDITQGDCETAEARGWALAVPRSVCTEASAVPYADKVDMASIDDVLRCETIPIENSDQADNDSHFHHPERSDLAL